VRSGHESDRHLAGRIAMVMCAALVLAVAGGAVACSPAHRTLATTLGARYIPVLDR
jgi:hypothetical protein